MEDTHSSHKKDKKFTTNTNITQLVQNQENLNNYLAAIDTMEKYTKNTNDYDVYRIEYNFGKIDKKYLSKMSYNYKDRVKRLKASVELNQKFLTEIAQTFKPPEIFYKDQKINMEEIKKLSYEASTYLNYGVFLYIARDWSINCEKERKEHYDPIIAEVEKMLPGGGKKILIPGASLCRLGYELALKGYDIDLCDFNHLNIILSEFLFNHSKKNMFTFQPLIRSFSNYLTEDAVFKEYTFPDVDINLEGDEVGKMHLDAGDFTKLYEGVKEEYDCVITCFFIDTAKNIFEYIEIIERVLKKGGIWINFGPLSYHWVGYDDVISVELPYDKLREVIINYGFEYISEDTSKVMTYCEVENFMKNDYYQCISFTAKKK